MNNRSAIPRAAISKVQTSERATIRPLVLLAVLLVVGVTLGVAWFLRVPSSSANFRAETTEANTSQGLSDATRAVLQRLSAPVEIRFYELLNESEAAAPRKAYAGRITGLLAEYERAGDGKIVLKRFGSPSEANSLAAKEGLDPLRLGHGELSYFGIAVTSQGQKAVLPNLAPEWEAALEFDLSRAIARVATGTSGAVEVVMNPSPVNVASTEELLQTIPEVESLSLTEATQKVKAAGLEEFKVAVAEIQTQLAEAHKNLAEAQKESSAAEQVARKKLQQLQAEQNEKLGEISRRMQGRLAALQQLKRATP